MPYTTIKQYGSHTATYKFLGQDENEQFLNEQEKEFHSILKKQATVLKVNQLQFLNNKQKCRSLIDNLLQEYDLFHREFGEKDSKNLPVIKASNVQNKINQNIVLQEQQEQKIEYENNLSLNMKSKIIFLQLQNKKLKMKEKILRNKHQKETIKMKIVSNFENQKIKKQKQLLQIELYLLQQIKRLTQQFQVLKNNLPSLSSKKQKLISNQSSKSSNLQGKKTSKIQAKKVSKLKIMKYLLEKTQNISSPEQFQTLLTNIQKNYQF